MKGVMVGSKTTSLAIFWMVLLVSFLSTEISAKRGCSAFGHSCYGGHGKRSDPETPEIEVLPRNVKDENRLDYEVGRDNVVLVPSEGFNRQDQRLVTLLHDRPRYNTLSLLLRKLLNGQYKTYAANNE